ncbi:hypothetical protein SSAG_03808 [Streptomyces sp. Mg1]|nr:hypothetical protein SSAG_03808 [Streptomyces sp. Mg1]
MKKSSPFGESSCTSMFGDVRPTPTERQRDSSGHPFACFHLAHRGSQE